MRVCTIRGFWILACMMIDFCGNGSFAFTAFLFGQFSASVLMVFKYTAYNRHNPTYRSKISPNMEN